MLFQFLSTDIVTDIVLNECATTLLTITSWGGDLVLFRIYEKGFSIKTPLCMFDGNADEIVTDFVIYECMTMLLKSTTYMTRHR